jgi:hypothetical protein
MTQRPLAEARFAAAQYRGATIRRGPRRAKDPLVVVAGRL